MQERLPKFIANQLGQNRNAVKIIVGLLSGHYKDIKPLTNIRVAEETLNKFCFEEEEAVE